MEMNELFSPRPLFNIIRTYLDSSMEMKASIERNKNDEQLRISAKIKYIVSIIDAYESLMNAFDEFNYHTLDTLTTKYLTDLLLDGARHSLNYDENIMDFFIDDYYPQISQLIFELLTAKKKEV